MSAHAVAPAAENAPAAEVLVVDDNPATRYATARVLRAAGFRTKEAGTGLDALNLVATGISAVILDVHLPDIDGFEVCSRIRNRRETSLLPVIHLSASHVLNDDKVRGLQAGADAYMTHPAEPALLVATLQALIRARTAEERMRRADAGFRAIYDQAPSGISLFDSGGRFAGVNPAMLALLKRSEPEVIGRPLLDFAAPDWHAAIGRHLESSRRGVWRGEFPLLDAGGAPVHMAWSLSQHVIGEQILAIATDVSERIALSQQREDLLEREQAARATAERLSRSKDEFIAVLSHELRTPLNAIMGWVHVLRRAPSPDNLKRGLETIERNAKIQTRLISDILEVSRMRMGKLRLVLEPTNVADVIDASVAALAESTREKSLSIDVALGDDLAPIVADPDRVQQIVWNLLTNAIKFSNAGGRIRIGLDRSEDALTLTVEDEGKGIDASFLPLIFERFTQSDPSSNREHGGLGLGLSIVRQLAELHGGAVAAYSEGLGRGAKFVARLPLVARISEDAAATSSRIGKAGPGAVEADALGGLRVLIVEDDADAREILGVVLRDSGARVSEAVGYDDALARLDVEVPDVLISDIGLPGRDGYALMREIRLRSGSASRRLPAIALTAFTRPKDQEAALAAGFDAHCAKPIRPYELVDVILGVLSRSPN